MMKLAQMLATWQDSQIGKQPIWRGADWIYCRHREIAKIQAWTASPAAQNPKPSSSGHTEGGRIQVKKRFPIVALALGTAFPALAYWTTLDLLLAGGSQPHIK
jgi:hypothetical protein